MIGNAAYYYTGYPNPVAVYMFSDPALDWLAGIVIRPVLSDEFISEYRNELV